MPRGWKHKAPPSQRHEKEKLLQICSTKNSNMKIDIYTYNEFKKVGASAEVKATTAKTTETTPTETSTKTNN